MKPNLTYRNLFWRMLFLYFLFIAYQILHSDYLFTDEAFMLWHQADHHTVFTLFHTEGRALTGWLEQWLFEAGGTAANVKYIRLLSLGECVLTLIFLFLMLRRWQQKGMEISDALIYATVGFVAASLSTTICIGWAVCTEVFIPTLLSLAAGWILYEAVGASTGEALKEGAPVKIATLTSLCVIALGVAALFFYQSPYPFLLLPFYFLFLTRKDGKLSKPVIVGLVYYFIILAVYFGLFKYWLKASGVVAADRTDLAFKPLDRLSFFFSFPLNQAFNGNAFFDARSILSQAVFPVLFLAWVVLTFYKSRRSKAVDKDQRPKTGGRIRYLLGMLAFWILGYLPLLIAQESFGPYRTMLVLSVMVFLMLADTVLLLIPSLRMVIVFALIGVMLVAGAYHYKVYLADPLTKEDQAVRTAVREGYTDRTREVVFIRASDHGFERSLGIGSFKDEFGMPSTNKDWTPEPLLKQLVYELTGNRQQAAALKVSQYASMEEWKVGQPGSADQKTAGQTSRLAPESWADSAVLHRDSILYINAPKLLNDLK